MCDHVWKREIVISKAEPKSPGISVMVNKPPDTQLAHYKLGRCQDTSDPGHFGSKTFRHYQTGAEVSGQFGTSAEVSFGHFGTGVELSLPR